jgi:hypothetical protein
MGALVIWGILGFTLTDLIEERTGRVIDSYGLLFFVPYFASMILFPSLGAWLGHVFAIGRRRSVITITSDAKNRSELGKFMTFNEWLKENTLIVFLSLFISTIIIYGLIIGGIMGFVLGMSAGWGVAYLIYSMQNQSNQDDNTDEP